eukprot:526721_1
MPRTKCTNCTANLVCGNCSTDYIRQIRKETKESIDNVGAVNTMCNIAGLGNQFIPFTFEKAKAISKQLWFNECNHFDFSYLNAFKMHNMQKYDKCPIETLFRVNNIQIPMPKYSQLYGIDEYESEPFRQWSDPYTANKVLCKHCFISVIPYLPSILHYIRNRLFIVWTIFSKQPNSTSHIKYLSKEINLIHFAVINDSLKYSFMVHHILKYQTLYEP